jgi:tetratricopeptide (TPR) repeat protein
MYIRNLVGITSCVFSVIFLTKSQANAESQIVTNSIKIEVKNPSLPNVNILQPSVENPLSNISLPSLPKPEFDFQDYDFWSRQCRVLENAQKYDETLNACEKAISLKPKRKNIDLWTSRSNTLMKLKRYGEAVVSYDQVIKRDRKNSQVLMYRCQALSALGNASEAIQSCENALRVNGNWGDTSPARAWYQRAIVQQQVKQSQEAVTSLERAISLEPNYSQALAEKCGVLSEIQRYDEAIKDCDRAIQANSQWGDVNPGVAWRNKAIALRKLGKFQDAAITYEQILSANPNDAEAWYEQGWILHNLAQYHRALTSYNRAVEINPKYSLAFARRGEILNELENYQEAFTSCEKAIAGDNNWAGISSAYIWQQRSTALLGLNKPEEALDSAERAIALKNDYENPWNNKAVSLWNLGKYEKAKEATEEALKINPKYTQAWFNYGRILTSIANTIDGKKEQSIYEKAIVAYNNALDGDIKSFNKQTRATILANKGAALWHLGDNALALISTNEAIQNNPQSFEAWYNKGIVLFDMGKYTEAKNAYDKADELRPNNQLVLINRGITLARRGEYQDALNDFERVLNLNPNNETVQKERENAIQNLYSNSNVNPNLKPNSNPNSNPTSKPNLKPNLKPNSKSNNQAFNH